MQYTYTEIKDESGVLLGIVRNEDNAGIPIDPANSDYQAYLNPVEHLTEIPTPPAE